MNWTYFILHNTLRSQFTFKLTERYSLVLHSLWQRQTGHTSTNKRIKCKTAAEFCHFSVSIRTIFAHKWNWTLRYATSRMSAALWMARRGPMAVTTQRRPTILCNRHPEFCQRIFVSIVFYNFAICSDIHLCAGIRHEYKRRWTWWMMPESHSPWTQHRHRRRLTISTMTKLLLYGHRI